jgi:hypothetical protein
MTTKSFCRDLYCNMNFSTLRYRNEHEKLMHKNLVKNAAYLLVDKIIETNPPELVQKKILNTTSGAFSYSDVKNLMNDETDDGKFIQKFMMNVVETLFEYHSDWGTKELIRISEFKIG